MNTGGLASEKTLLDEFAGQALARLLGSSESRMPFDVVHRLAYEHASAMLAEKARREADHSGDANKMVPHREVDNDYWAKFQDGIRIVFQPTNGWCAEIRDGSMGWGNTIAEAVENLRVRWEEKNVVPESKAFQDQMKSVMEKPGVVECVSALSGGNSPDAGKMAALEAANRELAEALKALLARDQRNTCRHEETHRWGNIWEICDQCGDQWADDEGGKPAWEDPPEWVKAEAIIAKHKGAA